MHNANYINEFREDSGERGLLSCLPDDMNLNSADEERSMKKRRTEWNVAIKIEPDGSE